LRLKFQDTDYSLLHSKSLGAAVRKIFTAHCTSPTTSAVADELLDGFDLCDYGLLRDTNNRAKHKRRKIVVIEGGGLMSYGTSKCDAWHQVGTYTKRILKGAKPGDLPVMRSTKFELVINPKTARKLGLEVPAQLRRRRDRMFSAALPLHGRLRLAHSSPVFQ
jgi:hypothetical protein